MHPNEITAAIIESSVKIHRRLGPGLLESVYETLLAHELGRRGLSVERQKPIPIHYEGLDFPDPFRVDLLVARKVVVELKSVEEVHRVHFRQTLTYLKLAHCPVALLINFNVATLTDGIHRLVNRLPE
jgi:iron complex transport system substrate-binding protein